MIYKIKSQPYSRINPVHLVNPVYVFLRATSCVLVEEKWMKYDYTF